MFSESSAFNRVNIRRLFMVLEESIKDSAMRFVFKPNDRDTRNQLVSMIDPFLADVKARRGVVDYLIVCNTTNNTPERVDRSELWCDIYVQPTKAAEFIRLNFIATRSGMEFTEI
jgi:phage tail sheath protein FI